MSDSCTWNFPTPVAGSHYTLWGWRRASWQHSISSKERPTGLFVVFWCRAVKNQSRAAATAVKMASGKGNSVYQGVFGALRTLMHLTAAVQFSYGIYYDYRYVEFPTSEPEMRIHHPWGGKFKYLTFLDAVI